MIFDQSRLRTQAPVLFGRAHQARGTLEAPHAVIAQVRVELSLNAMLGPPVRSLRLTRSSTELSLDARFSPNGRLVYARVMLRLRLRQAARMGWPKRWKLEDVLALASPTAWPRWRTLKRLQVGLQAGPDGFTAKG